MIECVAMMTVGVKGFFIALGFLLCAIAAFCALTLVAGLLGGIIKALKNRGREG